MYDNPYYDPYWLSEDESLEHFGIKGMKWGVRRYQNADGTLTEAGKKRYGTTEKFNEARERSKVRKQKAIKAAKIGGAIATSIVLASVGGATLDAAFNSGKGLAAVKKGSEILSYGLANEGQKTISAISKLLNVQSTGWTQSEPSALAKKLTAEMRYAAQQAETRERMKRNSSQFISQYR